MKVVSLVALLVLAACKPDPTTKPAPAEAPPSTPSPPAKRAPGPALPSAPQAAAAAGSDMDTGSNEETGSGSATPRRSRLDKNGDGLVSPEERLDAQSERAKRIHDRFDANHDGKLTPDELAATGSAQRGPHFDDPAALDTDKNGEISPAELQQGMRDLREKRRQQAIERGSAD